jgi:transcriptional regulator with XRE-family HTH domain
MRYDVQRMQDDMALRGWMATHLARVAGLSHPTVGLFLRGERQTAKTAHKLAQALGYTVRRYLIPTKRQGAA